MPPIPGDYLTDKLDQPDELLGRLALDLFITEEAKRKGLVFASLSEIPEEFSTWVVTKMREIEAKNAENDWLEKVLRLAAAGNFEMAGSRLREHMHIQRRSLDLEEGIPDMKLGAETRQQRADFGRKGAKATQDASIQRWQPLEKYGQTLMGKGLSAKRAAELTCDWYNKLSESEQPPQAEPLPSWKPKPDTLRRRLKP